jgi:hypothetical protein
MENLWLSEGERYDWRRWKGNCYEAAARFVLSEQVKGAVLMHGYPMGRGPLHGRRFGHAWAEAGGLVYDITVPHGGEGIDRDLYYQLGHLGYDDADVHTYTLDEARIMAVRLAHWGPWHGPDSVGVKTKRKPTTRKRRAA